MTVWECVSIVALTAWSVYRQTVVSEVASVGRFKMAITYAIVGVAVGGFDVPSGLWGYLMIAVGLVLSLVVGLVRGRRTRVWMSDDGRVFQRGTALTIGLFLGLVAVKFLLGILAYVTRVDDGAGFGEVLVMIAVMIAIQAQLIAKRAEGLRVSSGVDVERLPLSR